MVQFKLGWSDAASTYKVCECGASVGWAAALAHAHLGRGKAAAYHHVPADRPLGAQDHADFVECHTVLSMWSSSGGG